MRISLMVLSLLAVAGCGQPGRSPESKDETSGAGQRSQAEDTVSQDQGPQAAQRPEYGLGAPWPEAVLDETGSTLQNQVVVRFRDGLTEEQELALVDSIARSIHAAVLRNKFLEFSHYSFRWPPDSQIDRDSLVFRLKALSNVHDAWPETLTQIQ